MLNSFFEIFIVIVIVIVIIILVQQLFILFKKYKNIESFASSYYKKCSKRKNINKCKASSKCKWNASKNKCYPK